MNTEKRSFGERWVLRVGSKTLTRLGKYAPLILILCAIPIGGITLFFQFESGTSKTISVVYIVASVLLATICFERRNFYLIIEDQKKRIDELEEKLTAKDTDKSAEA